MIHKFRTRHHKIVLIIILVAVIISYFINPVVLKDMFLETDYSDILSILMYLPGFFILMGLIEVWLPQEFIAKHLGKQSGYRGSVYSFAIGSILPGPIYIAFPIAALLLKKKVSVFNVSLFIGAWSCMKIGEEIFEFQFLGARFLILRLLISIPAIFLISYIISRFHYRNGHVQS